MQINIKIMSGLVLLNKKLIMMIKNQIKLLIIKKLRSSQIMKKLMGRLKFRHANLKGRIIPKVHSLQLEKVRLVEEKNFEKASFKIRKNNLDLEIEIKILY